MLGGRVVLVWCSTGLRHGSSTGSSSVRNGVRKQILDIMFSPIVIRKSQTDCPPQVVRATTITADHHLRNAAPYCLRPMSYRPPTQCARQVAPPPSAVVSASPVRGRERRRLLFLMPVALLIPIWFSDPDDVFVTVVIFDPADTFDPDAIFDPGRLSDSGSKLDPEADFDPEAIFRSLSPLPQLGRNSGLSCDVCFSHCDSGQDRFVSGIVFGCWVGPVFRPDWQL